MKNLRKVSAVLFISLLSVTAISCKSEKKEPAKSSEKAMSFEKTTKVDQILTSYLNLKDALTKDDEQAAAKAGKNLYASFDAFDNSSYTAEQQETLTDIINDAKEQAEHIGKSEIPHQREHFKTLSKDLIDLIAITGSPVKLYEQLCPMYKKGSAWLSTEKNIVNPYYGSKMLTCGIVKKEINEKS